MPNPLVSVICLCHNHERFIESCLQSVIDQTYEEIEIILINDASLDNSRAEINQFLKNHPEIDLIDLNENVGNCKAFNMGLKMANGEFVIDLAADDLLHPDRIKRQIAAFQELDDTYGVVYSDAKYIDEDNREMTDHFHQYSPENGDLYASLVARYFIAPPTMMIKKVVLDELDGYDESLAYEDFDFWVRSSRNWKYDFVNEPLTFVRKLDNSLSSRFYQKNSPLIPSTFKVCQKIRSMNETDMEDRALLTRLKYEFKIAAVTGNRDWAQKFFMEMRQLHQPALQEYLLYVFSKLNWNIYPLIRWVRG